MRFAKTKRNPMDLIKCFWPNANIDHITFDPNLRKGDYNIIRQITHDGTLVFTNDMMRKLIVLVNCTSFYKLTEPKDWKKVKYIKYTVGYLKHVAVFGHVKLGFNKTKRYPGMRERIRIPVKCEYVYKELCDE